MLYCFHLRAPGILLEEFHGTVAKRNKNLKKVQRRNGVILTTYGIMKIVFLMTVIFML